MKNQIVLQQMVVQREVIESNFQEHGKLGEGEAHKGDIGNFTADSKGNGSITQQVNGELVLQMKPKILLVRINCASGRR
jgi:hypothetical protein